MPYAWERAFLDRRAVARSCRSYGSRYGRQLSRRVWFWVTVITSKKWNKIKRVNYRYLGGRRIKDLGVDDDGYPIELEGLAPPSLRDREFLQHSSLWGSQFIAGGSGEGSQRLKPDGSILSQPQMKTDPTLPAYCNPPNPCPVGYSGMDFLISSIVFN